ncbi:hypothetical protein BJV82DRAFT_712323 [Fennellomyces sp. T-0311]|nr:hypothetical protein BJV82DRAFT_712323 [Fennellomyces sp. T-0311]
MKVIPGNQADEGYYALSYAWNWCGDIVKDKDGKEQVCDHGLHKIIAYQEGVQRPPQWVKCKQIIRQLCQDLNIKYVWYDPMCIKEDERQEEIRETPQIYRHAYCTLILVPELNVTESDIELVGKMRTAKVDAISKSVWIKRINAYMWSNVAAIKVKSIYEVSGRILYNMCKKPLQWNASAALFHAKDRKTSVPHDRTFALVNLFPEVVKDIDMVTDYKQDPLDLLIQFYTALARKLLSILYFGMPANTVDEDETRWPKDDALSSWAGAAGIHIPHLPSTGWPPRTGFIGHNVHHRLLFLKSTGVSIPVETLPEQCDRSDNDVHINWSHAWERSIKVGLPSKASITAIMSMAGSESITKHFGLKISHRLPISKGKKAVWFDTSASPNYTELYLSLTDNAFTECVILTSILFEIGELYKGSRRFKAYPVVHPSHQQSDVPTTSQLSYASLII